MKKLLIVAIGICISLPTFSCEQRYVVSDFDDTIKTYGRDGEIFRIANALVARKANAGMKTLLEELSHECDIEQGFTILTASPKILGPSIKRLLRKHDVTNYELIMRPLKEKTYDYRSNQIIFT